jgi:cbb3-type cytochrome c oxidase subunit III
VAYLETLGRARELAWPDGDRLARDAAGEDRWALMSLNAPDLNAHPARARPFVDLLPDIGQAAPPATGRRLWNANCAGCHGVDGRGNGPAARWLEPAPSDLTARTFSRNHVANILWHGVHNTAMPAWRDHSPQARAALVEIVQSFSVPPRTPASSAQELALGRRVYADNCVECHGDDGGGDGFAADQFPVQPTNFQAERPTVNESIRVLQRGVPGTSMARWSDRLDDDEIDAVARYVYQLFRGESEVGDADR